MLQSLIVHSLTPEGEKTDGYVSFKGVGFDFGSKSPLPEEGVTGTLLPLPYWPAG